MVNCTLFNNIIIYDLMDNNIGKLHFIQSFINTCQLKCLYRLLVGHTIANNNNINNIAVCRATRDIVCRIN